MRVIDPRATICFDLPLASGRHRAADLPSACRAELDSRYPGGVDELSAGYTVYRRRGRRRLFCLAVPSGTPADAVPLPAVVPRRLCVPGRRVTVFRKVGDALGVVCLEGGRPRAVGGVGELGSASQSLEAVSEIIPAAFSRAPRRLLAPPSARKPWLRRAEAGPQDPEIRTAAGAAGIRTVTERRRPSKSRFRRGSPNATGSRVHPRILLAANLFFGSLLVWLIAAGSPDAGREAPALADGGAAESGAAESAPRRTAPANVARSVVALADTLHPVAHRAAVLRLQSAGAKLTVHAEGGAPQGFLDLIRESERFSDVVLVSERRKKNDRTFVIDATHREGVEVVPSGEDRPASEKTALGATGLSAAKRILAEAGLEDLRVVRAASGEGYELGARGTTTQVAGVVSKLASAGEVSRGHRIVVARLGISRLRKPGVRDPRTSRTWELSFTISATTRAPYEGGSM